MSDLRIRRNGPKLARMYLSLTNPMCQYTCLYTCPSHVPIHMSIGAYLMSDAVSNTERWLGALRSVLLCIQCLACDTASIACTHVYTHVYTHLYTHVLHTCSAHMFCRCSIRMFYTHVLHTCSTHMFYNLDVRLVVAAMDCQHLDTRHRHNSGGATSREQRCAGE